MTDEISELRVRWQYHRQTLLRADYNHADEELARAIHFADDAPLIAAILQDLRSTSLYQEFDAEEWLSSRGITEETEAVQASLLFSLDTRERAIQCLRVIELAIHNFNQRRMGLVTIGGITFGGTGTKLIDRIRSAIDQVFDPFYHYVDGELRSQSNLITPVDILKQIQSLVDGQADLKYPQAGELLSDTYRQLFSLAAESSGASWNQIGYSCRHVLVRFANEVFDPQYVPEDQDQPKGDDVQAKLRWTARYHLRQIGAGDRYRGAVEKIIEANWRFVNSVGHRQESATEEDARLAVIYTYLTVSLVDRLITSTP